MKKAFGVIRVTYGFDQRGGRERETDLILAALILTFGILSVALWARRVLFVV